MSTVSQHLLRQFMTVSHGRILHGYILIIQCLTMNIWAIALIYSTLDQWNCAIIVTMDIFASINSCSNYVTSGFKQITYLIKS